MDRRKALVRISWVFGGTLASYTGFKLIKFSSTPDLENLRRYKNLISSLSDTIIPKSDSPSASECNVQDFVIRMMENCTSVRLQNKFINGLQELEGYSTSEYERSFINCLENQKIQILNYFEERDRPLAGIIGRVQEKIWGKSFFTILKECVTRGYFTSMPGATIALRYSHIPTKYNSCEFYTEGEKAWATY